MAKKLIAALFLISSASSVSAHQFWPDSYDVMKPGANASAMIMTHLHSDIDAYYQFSIFKDQDRANAKNLGTKQMVFAGENTDFPIIVPHSMLSGKSVTLCSLQIAKKDTMQKEVCLRINIL